MFTDDLINVSELIYSSSQKWTSSLSKPHVLVRDFCPTFEIWHFILFKKRSSGIENLTASEM